MKIIQQRFLSLLQIHMLLMTKKKRGRDAFHPLIKYTYIPMSTCLQILLYLPLCIAELLSACFLHMGMGGYIMINPDNFHHSRSQADMLMLQYNFGVRSCFDREVADIILSFGTGVLVQFLCAYVTLPLYALVTQVGHAESSRLDPITLGCSLFESLLFRWVLQ